MDDNRIEGTVRELGGKAQSAAGELLGDSKMQGEGMMHQAAGRLQDGYGAAADRVRGLSEEAADVIKDTPLLAVLGALGLGYLIGRLTSR